MKKRIVFFLYYALFWFVYFLISKLVFLFYHYNQSFNLPVTDWFLVLLNGSRLDISITGYFMVLPGLFLIATPYFKTRVLIQFFKYYTIVFLVITSFIIITDMELYRHWGFRMDSTPLLYIKNPKEIAGSMDPTATIIQVIVWAGLFISALMIYKKLLVHLIVKIRPANWKISVVFLFITSFLILPIRGGVGIAPINVGFVYFHETSVFANHAAINVIWNVGHSLSKINDIKPSRFFDNEKAERLFNELYVDNGTTKSVFKIKKPNIIIVILESFTSKVIEPLGGIKGITPKLNALCREGILFSNFYAAGDRTDKGILAVINGYPSQPTTSIVKYAKKTEKLPFLNQDLAKIGYFTEWIYGYDVDYANFRSYFMNAKFNKLITKSDFPSSTYNSKWGVHDHVVFNKLFDECKNARTPFFMTYMTQSSHEPFEVPVKTVIEGSDEEHLFLNSIHYTDKSLGEFIEKAKRTKWWDSTLIILVADHGARHPDNTPHYAVKKFHIPMLWIGGALNVKDTIVTTFGSQTDIPATISSQLGIHEKNYKFSQNLFSSNAGSFAYYDFNNGFGFLRKNLSLVYDNIAQKYIIEEGVQNDKDLEIGKAYLQVLMNDFLQR